MTGLRRALISLALLGLIVGAIPLILAVTTPEGHHRGLIAVFGPLIGYAFIGSGLYAWWRHPDNGFGALMTAVGYSYCISGLVVATEPWLFTIGLLFLPLPYAILLHILVAFPTGRLRGRFDRVVVGVGYLRATVAHWTAVLFQDSTRQGLPANQLLVEDNVRLVVLIYRVRFTVGLLLFAGLVVILISRWRTASPPQRRALAPVLISGGLVMALFAAWDAASLARLPEPALGLLERARVVMLATVPFAFLGGLLRSRVAQAGAVTRLVARLGDGRNRRQGLRDELAEALGDPSLTLAYWLPERGEYVDADGRRVELPAQGSGRVWTPVDSHGQRIAVLLHDGSLGEEDELVRAVGAAAALTLENERLDAALRAKLIELQESRARIVESTDAARRRIERDLHDGAQQRLVSTALNLRLAQAKLRDEPQTTRSLLESASQELDLALAELRELARGIHPAVLSERGLDVALRGLAARAPVPVELAAVPQQRMAEKLEATAYFVVAEAITNVAKYAQASHATVAVRRDNGQVVVEVADDGVGGADPDSGTGLRGLADRVAALNGRLEIDSHPGRGTAIRARIPCG